MRRNSHFLTFRKKTEFAMPKKLKALMVAKAEVKIKIDPKMKKTS